MAHPDQARLKAFLRYDPETGDFFRLVTRGGQVPGKVRRKPDALGYMNVGFDGKARKAHRLAWLYMTGEWPTKDIDHINGNPSDNRFENLREATETQNKINEKRRCDNTSGFKGAKPHKGKWQARICVGGTRKSLGYYNTAAEAHEAYMRAARDIYGEFARAA